MQLNPSAIEDLEAAGVKEVGCRILRNLLKNFCACLYAAPTAVAGYLMAMRGQGSKAQISRPVLD
jgi:hypothetical protein